VRMDNGYAVGYLDDGEFVEVGRFNNLDAVANSDLEIRHADSETRVVLGDDGFDFDGSDVEGIEALDVQSASVPQVTSNVDFDSNDATGISALEAEEARITGNEDIKISVPADFDTVADALEAAGENTTKSGVQMVVTIESGHEIVDNLDFEDGDWGHVRLTSEDDMVGLGTDYPDGEDFWFDDNAVGPVLDCLVDLDGRCRGMFVHRQSTQYVEEGAGIRNALDFGVRVREESGIYARNAEFSGTTHDTSTAAANARITADSDGVFTNADLSNSGADVDGLVSNRGATVQAVGVDCSDCGRVGARGVGAATLNVAHADVSGAGNEGIRGDRTARIKAIDVDATDCDRAAIETNGAWIHLSDSDLRGSERGIFADRSGRVEAQDCLISDEDNPTNSSAVVAQDNAEINIIGSTVDYSASTALRAEDGGKITARSVTATNAGSHAVWADGGEIDVREGDVSDADSDDIRRSDGGIVRAEGCQTTQGDEDEPHEDDVNFPREFNSFGDGRGIVFAENFTEA